MAATVTIQGCTGTNAATEATITALMFRSNDSVAVTTANPITIPTGSPVYSYEKWIRFKCTVAPAVQCTNFKFWGGSSVPGTGLKIYAGTTASGATPVNTASSVATTQQDTNYYDASHTLSISGTLVNVNDETNYLVTQLQVSSTASQGNMTQQTFNYSYDEN